MYHYSLPNTPKMLKETLGLAQYLIGQSDDPRKNEHVQRLQDVINECERMRPISSNGKHGNLHTLRCGCADMQTEAEKRQEWHFLYNQKECPTCQLAKLPEDFEDVCPQCGRDYGKFVFPIPTKMP
jgi:hypothetical protein